MKLANASDRIHAAGAEVIALVVDSDERNAAMIPRWGTGHVKFVSDPGGEAYLRAMEMYDPDERGGIALPGLFVIDSEGNEVFGYRGNDFADRRNDDDMFAPLEALGLEAMDAPAAEPIIEGVDDSPPGAFPPKLFVGYFKGNKFGAKAISMRAAGDEAQQLAAEHMALADSMLDAWAARAS